LYEYEAWFLPLWNKQKLQAIERDDELTEEWSLHIEEPHNLYCSPNILMVITSRRVTCSVRETTSIYNILVSIPYGPFGKPRHKEVGFEIITAVTMKRSIFWDIMPCSLLKVNQCFGGSTTVLTTCFMLVSFLAYCSNLKL
jgi:hypothetical protein